MKTKVFIAFALLISTALTLQAQVYSLDENPSAPITGMPVVATFSAEDPYGLGLPPVGAGLIGPSPSMILGPPFLDSDMLFGGPALNIAIPPLWLMDGISENHAPLGPFTNPIIYLKFSVDRMTGGNSALGGQMALNQYPADIYQSIPGFAHPGGFAGGPGPAPYAGALPTAVAGAVGTNFLFTDEGANGLTAGNGPGVAVGPGVACPPIVPGSHDNVDAYNDYPSASLTFSPIYFTTPPAEAALSGSIPGNIYLSVPPPHGWAPGAIFAPAGAIGLDTVALGSGANLDDIDALVVWDYVTPGALNPGADYALFSLSPGSASLAALMAMDPNINPASIFFTDFTGKFWTYIYSPQVGVTMGIDYPCFNIDALEAL